MADMGAVHEIVFVPDYCSAPRFNTSMQRDIISDRVVVADDNSTSDGLIKTNVVWVSADEGSRPDSTVASNSRAIHELSGGVDSATVTDDDVICNNSKGPDSDVLAELGGFRDDG